MHHKSLAIWNLFYLVDHKYIRMDSNTVYFTVMGNFLQGLIESGYLNWLKLISIN